MRLRPCAGKIAVMKDCPSRCYGDASGYLPEVPYWQFRARLTLLWGHKHLILAKSIKFDEIKENPEEILAVVILLDQFSRNIYRDSPRSFAHDNIALNIVLKSIEKGLDKKMKAVERAFFYMPLMHSEDIEVQEKSVECFSGLEAEYKDNDDFAQLVTQNRKYAVLHYDIIQKFGRYPHRNKILGRKSTSEEMEFLKGPGSSF